MSELPYPLFAATVHALGIVGLFAVTLLPLRTFLAIRSHRALWNLSAVGKMTLLLVALVAALTLSFSVPLIAKVYRCLAGAHCGASGAAGLLHLSAVGAAYLVFELVANLAFVVARRAGRGRR